MADEVDDASAQSELFLQQALANLPVASKLQPRGNCHYCEFVFEKKDPDRARKLFCDADCADDHAREQRLMNRR